MGKGLTKILLCASVIELFATYNFPKAEERFYVPFPEVLKKIEQEKYIKEKNDCRHKAIKYHKYLMENGENSYVIECWNIKRKLDINHAMVIVQNKETGKYHLIDPTNKSNVDGARMLRYSKEWLWLRLYEKNVCPEDLEKIKRNFLKRFEKNIEIKERILENNNL